MRPAHLLLLPSAQEKGITKGRAAGTPESDHGQHALVVDAEFLPGNINIYHEERRENREEVYNLRAAENSKDLYLLDKAQIEIAGQRRYEVCDLLYRDRAIIHVKRYSSGAASISHLFTQGKFYAHAFSTDPACRAGMVKWIRADETAVNANKDKAEFISNIPEKTIDLNEKDYLVIFCVLHDEDDFTLERLPFMSRYELMLSHRFLTENRRFKAGIAFRKVLLGPPAAA